MEKEEKGICSFASLGNRVAAMYLNTETYIQQKKSYIEKNADSNTRDFTDALQKRLWIMYRNSAPKGNCRSNCTSVTKETNLNTIESAIVSVSMNRTHGKHNLIFEKKSL